MFKTHRVDHRETGRQHPGFMHKALLMLTLGTLLTRSWKLCRETHVRRLEGRPQQKAEPLQTWEGEGGQNQTTVPATSTPAAELAR